jgi:hypothetical protein
MLVEFVRRDHEAWPGLSDFTSQRRVQPNKMDLASSRRDSS